MDIAGTPFTWLEFDERGVIKDPTQGDALRTLLTPNITDLVVISHGWKNDKFDAFSFYHDLWSNVMLELGNPQGFVLVGVLWPALAFRTNFDSPVTADGGALSLPEPAGGDGDLSLEAFTTLVDDAADLAGVQGGKLRTAANAAQGGIGPVEAQALIDVLSQAFPSRITNADSELKAVRAPLVQEDPQEIFLDLMAPPPMTLGPGTGSAQGLGAMIGQALAGPRAAIARGLNQFTFYEMKARAGDVGAAMGARILAPLTPPVSVRLHLIGHSFGARLVTAAASSFTPPPKIRLQSLTLLQGAFSHNAFSSDFGGGQAGAFARIMGTVAGPISATHTHNDSACTLAYALASRLVRDNATAIGDADDQFGAIGANGVLHLPSNSVVMQTMSPTSAYQFIPGKVHNFFADACISEHSDVRNAQVGRLVASVLSS